MAYKIKRKHTIEDELIIDDLNGKEALRIPVNIYIDDILTQYNRLRRILGEAQHNVEEDPTSEKAITDLGEAVVALFNLIFGDEWSSKLLKFYDNRWSEMLEDVAPFIVECIQPKINMAMRDRADKFRRMSL